MKEAACSRTEKARLPSWVLVRQTTAEMVVDGCGVCGAVVVVFMFFILIIGD